MRGLNPSSQKLAEKLTILNDRGIGMLTRLYNIKKNLNDVKSKPQFLADKTLEPIIRQIVKRFPNPDTRTLSTQLSSLLNAKQDITKGLNLYYFTLVDILDFKDHVCELLTTMDACQLKLDITVNFDLTKCYLDLIVTYVTLMIMLSRIEDRKAILGLFNTVHEISHSNHEQSFPRLSQMIIDYENPMKKLAEEFVPHAKLLLPALLSLHHFFIMRNLSTDEWRKSQILSLVGNPAHLLTPTCTDSLQCEYLSLDTMERYIIFGFMLTYQSLNEQHSNELFFKALQNGWVTTLFRDEVILTHTFVQNFFEGTKGHSKRVSDVKDAYNYSLQNAASNHRERRKFLRTALKELGLIFADQPGLLGPKVLLIFIGLSFARDEVNWLLRHFDNLPAKQNRPKSLDQDLLIDRQLPELLFHIEELRALVRKYNQVIQRYYVQFLISYDAIALNQLMQNISMLPEDDSVILESIYQIISNLSVKQVENNELFDFRGLRLDWFRLQAYTSVNRYPLNLFENKSFANLLNTIVFHTKVVDYLDEMLVETSNLSFFCFYNSIFEDQFHKCLEFPAQTRYIIAFPLICSHFMNCNHELCPEERHVLGERSLTLLNIFLDEMAKEAKNIITTICDKQCSLSDMLLPKHAAPQIAQIVHKKKNLTNRKDRKSKNITPEQDKPGSESYRRSREELTTMDKLHQALTELCFAINYCPSIHIWEHTFAPREYLVQHLESRFSKALVGMVMYNVSTESVEIAKPSELLNSVRTYMNVLHSIENYVHIDITRVFNDVLLQQTQPQDSHGDKTITSLYTNWYLEILLRKVSTGQIVYSPVQKAFVTLPSDQPVPFLAEEFSDVTELRALAELIGPYGIKYLNESLMCCVASQVTELKKLVVMNKEVLVLLRSNFDKPEQMKELFKRLQNVDNLLQRMTIIGVILCFRGLIQEALYDNLSDRIPFLLSSIEDFKHNITNGPRQSEDPMVENYKYQIVSEMSTATGLSCKVDPDLVNALKKQKTELGDDDYQIACHLIVFIAVSLPKLARQENSVYNPSLEAHANNIHCLAQAINVVAGALFAICKNDDTEDRLKEFLALASSSLLRLGQEYDKEAIRNRESVYLLLDLIVKESPFLSLDLLESCFPFCLISSSYRAVFIKHQEGS